MLVDLQDRLELQEQRQQQMIGFLAAALQNPGLVQVGGEWGTRHGLHHVLQYGLIAIDCEALDGALCVQLLQLELVVVACLFSITPSACPSCRSTWWPPRP